MSDPPPELHLQRHRQLVEWYRQERPPLAPRRFAIFCRGRSGSTVLTSLLNAVEGIHCDKEILRLPVEEPRLHIDALCARSEAPCYGFKILSYQLKDVQPIADGPAFLRDLLDSGFRLLYLRRTNLLRHALSNIAAREHGFHVLKNEPGSAPAERRLTVEPEQVLQWMRGSDGLARYEASTLTGLPHLSLTYEEHLEDEGQHQATVDRICDYLEVSSGPVQTDHRKAAPRDLSSYVTNHEELLRFLRQTEYSDQLVD